MREVGAKFHQVAGKVEREVRHDPVLLGAVEVGVVRIAGKVAAKRRRRVVAGAARVRQPERIITRRVRQGVGLGRALDIRRVGEREPAVVDITRVHTGIEGEQVVDPHAVTEDIGAAVVLVVAVGPVHRPAVVVAVLRDQRQRDGMRREPAVRVVDGIGVHLAIAVVVGQHARVVDVGIAVAGIGLPAAAGIVVDADQVTHTANVAGVGGQPVEPGVKAAATHRCRDIGLGGGIARLEGDGAAQRVV